LLISDLAHNAKDIAIFGQAANLSLGSTATCLPPCSALNDCARNFSSLSALGGSDIPRSKYSAAWGLSGRVRPIMLIYTVGLGERYATILNIAPVSHHVNTDHAIMHENENIACHHRNHHKVFHESICVM
jgi:hypothetical protein